MKRLFIHVKIVVFKNVYKYVYVLSQQTKGFDAFSQLISVSLGDFDVNCMDNISTMQNIKKMSQRIL